jgi:hypothetical protein
MNRLTAAVLAATSTTAVLAGVGATSASAASPTDLFTTCKPTSVTAVRGADHRIHFVARWACHDSRGRAVNPGKVRVTIHGDKRHVRRFAPDTWDAKVGRSTPWLRAQHGVESVTVAASRGLWRTHVEIQYDGKPNGALRRYNSRTLLVSAC